MPRNPDHCVWDGLLREPVSRVAEDARLGVCAYGEPGCHLCAWRASRATLSLAVLAGAFGRALRPAVACAFRAALPRAYSLVSRAGLLAGLILDDDDDDVCL